MNLLLMYVHGELSIAATDGGTLEPFGPDPFPENWRYYFAQGTLQLFLNQDAQALSSFEEASRMRESAETYNNLGVAYTRLGKAKPSKEALRKALDIMPDYLDAKKIWKNQAKSHPIR